MEVSNQLHAQPQYNVGSKKVSFLPQKPMPVRNSVESAFVEEQIVACASVDLLGSNAL
jgi:hypothetical protein